MIFRWFVGIDWAAEKYDVCVLDASGKGIAKRVIKHSGTAIAELLDWLQEIAGGNPAAVAVAIETPRGAMVEGLVERGFGVFAINPKQLDRFRDRYTVAGAKDDSRDAFVLGDSLRTDQACFHRVQLDSAQMLRLRELSRLQEELQVQENRLSNQLWEQVASVLPADSHLKPCGQRGLVVGPHRDGAAAVAGWSVEAGCGEEVASFAPDQTRERRGGPGGLEGAGVAAGAGRGRSSQ
jgi:hypothetical protein